MSDKKIYVGNGRKVDSQYGVFRSVSICVDDLPEQHMTKHKNGKRYIKLNIGDKQGRDEYGNDVAVTVDTWKPKDQ